ncbi:helix-turn-helix domain-containing protein [Muricauda sp. 2012CJ35-5]|uniref:Helix-turn-helix domain-containing protein n=1 Tax=Flagellimonas spongiicola TaxID=2942208 RepID=A0ABT0PS85_9FLAO|nr:helix-turn-helix domain-containing protein [Allomuricauda spongiicola]MCL6273851.1 helix-turn-helix domain-containing protein [Allomuricauda spongiicola]
MDLISIFGLGFTAIGLFFSLFLLIANIRGDDSYIWLYVLLLLLSLELGFKTLVHSRLFLDYPFWYSPGRFYNLLLYPVFFVFIRAAIKKPLASKWTMLLVLPFIFYALYKLALVLALDMETKRQMLQNFYADKRPGPFNYWNNLGTLVKSLLLPMAFLIPGVYSFLGFLKSPNKRTDRLLASLLAISIVVYFLFTATSNRIYGALFNTTSISFIEWPVDIVFLIALLGLFTIMGLLVNSGSSLLPPKKYAASSLQENEYAIILERLKTLMDAEQSYLDPDLAVSNVAEILQTNSKYISQAINHGMGIGFTDFVNGYRVLEAKRQLKNPDNKQLTLEAIGNISGFQSKSTFFRVFKKLAGKTPSEYLQP